MKPELLIDGYKLDHRRQYPPGTEYVYSNWTARKSRIDGQNEVVFFGLQYFLQKYLQEDLQNFFFNYTGQQVEQRYVNFINKYLGPNTIGADHIKSLHNLGYFPLRFDALPEGALIPIKVPMFTVENTAPDYFWLVNYIETLLSYIVWMPCTSATIAYRYRKLFEERAKTAGDVLDNIKYQGHDFSFRGMAGLEAAALSGAGHLLSFDGTDTIPAIDLVEKYYSASNVGASVPATEHSVMCAGGEVNELETFERLLDLYPTGILSIVSDTWNLWNVLDVILPKLKDKIMARKGKLVIRPDSGDPVDIICGTGPGVSSDKKGVIETLWDIFGGTETYLGHRVLDEHIGAVYGDSITYERADHISKRLMAKRFSPTNLVYGIGSYTYQYQTRDTFGFAMKATWAQVDGKPYSLFKKPITDSGEKHSAKGRLAVLTDDEGKYYVKQDVQPDDFTLMCTIFEDGKFYERDSFSTIRRRLWSQF